MAGISPRIPVEWGHKQDQLEYLLPVAGAITAVGNVAVASLKPLGWVVLWTVIPERVWGKDVLAPVFVDGPGSVAYEEANLMKRRTRVRRKPEATLKLQRVDKIAATWVGRPWKIL